MASILGWFLFPPLVITFLSELSTMTYPSLVALLGIAHSCIELYKPLRHDEAVAREGNWQVALVIKYERKSKFWSYNFTLVPYQFSSVAQSCLTLCNPMNRSMPSLPVHHQLLEFTQTHLHWVGDAIQPSHPLLSPSPPPLNLSQQQGLFTE